jgi:hypothetical protein
MLRQARGEQKIALQGFASGKGREGRVGKGGREGGREGGRYREGEGGKGGIQGQILVAGEPDLVDVDRWVVLVRLRRGREGGREGGRERKEGREGGEGRERKGGNRS